MTRVAEVTGGWRGALVGFGLVTLLAGCPSTTLYRTADPTPPGRWQVAAATGVGGFRDQEQESRIPTAHFELAVRRGLRQGLDAGLKLYTFGTEVNATWVVARGAWQWALAPSLGGARTRESGVITDAIHLFTQVTAIGSRRLSRRWQLSLGPYVGWGLYWPETGGHAQGAWLGGLVNTDLQFAGGCWHLTPELGLYRVLAGEVPVRGGAISLGVAVRRDL